MTDIGNEIVHINSEHFIYQRISVLNGMDRICVLVYYEDHLENVYSELQITVTLIFASFFLDKGLPFHFLLTV